MSYTTKSHSMFEDSCNLQAMNERVQNLASNVYKEFELIISHHGPNTVKSLMPVVVNILESLDQNLKEKQKYEIDLELSKVEIEHLRNQCDKEKTLRRSADLKFLEMEDLVEETKKQFNQFKSSSELSSKRLEMKVKNLQEHINRLEEKEIKSKDDYSKLHTKYSDLLKSHADYVQKTNIKHQEQNELKKCLNCHKTEVVEIKTDSPICSLEVLTSNKQMVNIITNVNKLNESRDINYSSKSLETELSEVETSHFSQKSPEQNSDVETSLKSSDSYNQSNINVENNVISITENTKNVQTLVNKNKNLYIHHSSNDINLENESSFNKNNNAQINPTAYIDSPPDSYPSTNHSQEDLNHNKTVDALFGECIIASNTGMGTKLYINTLDNDFNDKIAAEETILNCDNIYGSDDNEDSLNHLLGIEEDVIIEDNNSNTNNISEYDPVKNISLYEELSIMDEDVGADLVSVGAEVDKLIQENAELLATKNALNVLKDDLIADVEELSGEVELLKEEIQTLNEDKSGLAAHITELDEELKKCHEEISQIQAKYEEKQQDEMGKTTFSRAELVRVLMERNQYKEKWMELQEAVRWAETVRASRAHPELMAVPTEAKKSRTSAVWGFFNSFLGKEKDDD